MFHSQFPVKYSRIHSSSYLVHNQALPPGLRFFPNLHSHIHWASTPGSRTRTASRASRRSPARQSRGTPTAKGMFFLISEAPSTFRSHFHTPTTMEFFFEISFIIVAWNSVENHACDCPQNLFYMRLSQDLQLANNQTPLAILKIETAQIHQV